MTKSSIEMALESPPQPTPGKWGRIKQGLRALYQDESFTPDPVLTEKIRQALGTDGLLGKTDTAHMRVTVNKGVATVSGHVVRSISKARAALLASETSGAVEMVNHLTADEELTIDIAQALGHDPRTQGEQIQVNVQHGVVYLGGAVQDAAVRTAATTVAASIPQARGVINVIKTPGIVLDTDEERFVQPQIASAIYATDGLVGHVQQVIINPHNRRVTAVVVNAHSAVAQDPAYAQPPADRPQAPLRSLIPMQRIRLAPSGVLFLNVNGTAAARFVDFEPLGFVAPPADWQPPYPYGWADVQFYVDGTDSD